MKTGIVAWWARNPVAANLLMLGILISGFLAYRTIDRIAQEAFNAPAVEISITWPGASPQDVEEQLIVRIEEALQDLGGIDDAFSVATEGFGRVQMVIEPSVDLDDFANEVKLRVDSIASFPRDIEPPRVQKLIFRQAVFRFAVHGDVSEKQLNDAAERLRTAIDLQPGISFVETFGVRQEEVSVELSEDAMRRYGVTFDDVAQAIRASSLNRSAGSVRTESGDIAFRARNLADTKADFESIIVRQTADGAAVRVGDVARVIDGFENEELLATFDGERAVLIEVLAGDRVDVVKQSKTLRTWLEEEAPALLPPGVDITLWEDNSKAYTDRMSLIGSSALMGLGLVFVLLLLTLDPRTAVWVTIGIGTAFAGAFIFLPAFGVSLNMLSLFAFLLVIGVVVDDAIVVGESIHKREQEGQGGVAGAVVGTQLVGRPVIFAVLTTMIAFAPFLFISGTAAQFVRQISIVIILALTFSLIEALLILPTHLSHRGALTKVGGWVFGNFDRYILGPVRHRVSGGLVHLADVQYRRFLTGALHWRFATVAAFFGVLFISFALMGTGWVKSRFMPQVEGESIRVEVDLPDGTSFARALEVLDQLQQAQRALQSEINALAEDGDGQLIENWYTRARPTSVLAIVALAPAEQRTLPAAEAAKRLQILIGEIPDAEEVEVDFTVNEGGSSLQFVMGHRDLDVLRTASDELRRKLAEYEDVIDVRDDLQSASDEVRFSLKPGAAALGISLDDISRQVRQAYFGEEVQRLPREGEDVRVMVRFPLEDRRSLDSLQDVRVRTADGRAIPLSAVADIEFAPGVDVIVRRRGARSSVLTADLADDVSKRITDDLEESFFPEWEKRYPGIQRGAFGESLGQQEFLAELQTLYIVALFVMYALIAIAFRSYALPLLVLTAIPFGFMGAVFGHFLFDMPMALFSYFGIGAAAGVVVNDNLVLVDYVQRLRERGLGAFDSLVESGVARFRAITLTSATTFIGLMPMIAERSTQAQFLKPTIVALAFAVVLATGVTLVLVPCLYAVGVDLNRLFGWLGRWLACVVRSIGSDEPYRGPGPLRTFGAHEGETAAKLPPRGQPAE